MVKVFISVGMTGRKEIDVLQDIEMCKASIKLQMSDDDIEYVHNYDCEDPTEPCKLWFLGEAIKKLGDCDFAYFAEGWSGYRGCIIERHVCREYRIPFIH